MSKLCENASIHLLDAGSHALVAIEIPQKLPNSCMQMTLCKFVCFQLNVQALGSKHASQGTTFGVEI